MTKRPSQTKRSASPSRAQRPIKQPVDWPSLITEARAARSGAYAPYSKFPVGAAVLGESGRIFRGCNVENVSYGLSVCAERNAVAQAVVNGEKRILAVAIAAGDRACPPCGVCRQVLAEFAGPDLPIVLVAGRSRAVHQLGDLLPYAFDKSFL